jgi:putative SOS response-associated peptidase YedK
MPVILTPETWSLWLGRQSDPSELQGLLRPYPGDLRLYPVAPLVNSVRQQGPELIAPLLPG